MTHADLDDPTGRLARHRAETAAGYLSVARRLSWSAERLAAYRRERLRAVLAHAAGRSSFHAERLGDVDTATFSEEDLPSLPVMTKADLMDHFDEAVTDPRLTFEAVQHHAEQVDRTGNPYLFDEFRVMASSGSSGLRGYHVYSSPEWTDFALMTARTRLSLPEGSARPSGSSVVSLFGTGETVISGAVQAFLGDPAEPFHHVPMTLPPSELVDKVGAADPVVLQGYPSALDLLTRAARAGRLDISPRYVESGGEFLPERTRREVREVWGVDVDDCWGLTEGIMAVTCRGSRSMHLPDDFVVIEPIDRHGAIVPPGTPADSVLVTSLYRFTQPLIRYQLSDALTVLDDPCACGSAHRRIVDLAGRNDAAFAYTGDVQVYPTGLGLILTRDRSLVQFQVVQTARGVRLRLVPRVGESTDQVEADVRQYLVGAGLVDPEVTVELVDHLEHLPSGKLQHFVPLSG